MTEEFIRVTVRCPKEMHERLRRMSFESRRSNNDILLQAIDEYLKKEGYTETE